MFTTLPELVAAAMTYKGMSTRPLVIPNNHIVKAIPDEWEHHLVHIKKVTENNIKSSSAKRKVNPSILNGTFRNYWMMFYVNIEHGENEDAGIKETKIQVAQFLKMTLRKLGWKMMTNLTNNGTVLYHQKTLRDGREDMINGKLLIPPQKDIYSTNAIEQLPSYEWNQDKHEQPWRDINNAMDGNNINFLTNNITPSNMMEYIKGEKALANGPLERTIVDKIAKAVCDWTNAGNSPDSLQFKERLVITVIQTHAFLKSDEKMDESDDKDKNENDSNEGSNATEGGANEKESNGERGNEAEEKNDVGIDENSNTKEGGDDEKQGDNELLETEQHTAAEGESNNDGNESKREESENDDEEDKGDGIRRSDRKTRGQAKIDENFINESPCNSRKRKADTELSRNKKQNSPNGGK